MFSSTSNTLVSNELIQNGLSNINVKRNQFGMLWGYFEPIYDTTKPYDLNMDIPYKIIGSKFIPVIEEEVSSKATVQMLLQPNIDSRRRYYQGSDPISSDTGVSMFASVVFDKIKKAPACIMNYRRKHDVNYIFLQSMLMGIYYDTNDIKSGIPDLVESNVGDSYANYKDQRGWGRKIVTNGELPIELKGGGKRWGVDNHGLRTDVIINKLRDYITNYSEHIYYDIIFEQLRTFVATQKENKTHWGSIDKRAYCDDVLFALAYAYICSEVVYVHSQPTEEKKRDYYQQRIVWKTKNTPQGLTRIRVAV